MDRLVDHDVTFVAVCPGTRTWVARGKREGAVSIGTLGEAGTKSLTYGGKKAFEHHVIAARGLDAATVVMTDGACVTRLALRPGARALAPVKRWELPGELGWHAFLAVSASGDVVIAASDLRLAAFGGETRVVEAEGRFDQHFRCPALLPDGETLLVGRGDGRIELRDVRTLELRDTFAGNGDAVLAVCVLDDDHAAIATDDASTALLDLRTGERTELDLSRMKTSGLHRRHDGALVVVGLSRRITIFEGTRKVREGDHSELLGDRYIQASALAEDTLLLACETKGLWAVALSSLPAEAEPVSLPAPPDEIRAAVTAAAGLSLLHAALAAKRDVASVVATLLARDDENIRRGVFYALAMSSTPLPDATVHLASPLARVRYYAADHYGELSTHFTGRAAELEALLHDADASVVGAAAWALGRLGDRRAAAWLTPLLGSSEEWVRVTAANALLALGAGANEIADAIRAGAGELTFCILMAKWPSLTPSLREAAPADLVERLAAGVHLDALLRELSFAASAELLVEHGATELRATLPPTVNRTQVLSACVLARRWAITFDGTTLTLTTHGAAADFWAKALAEN